VIDRSSGETLRDSRLPAPLAFNGMAASSERFYAALQDGSVLCSRGWSNWGVSAKEVRVSPPRFTECS
jgi:hypothetical protein